MHKGMVYVFTGEGKGKTSAGFWTGVRAALSGKKVAVVQWYKESRWPTAEQEISKFIPNFAVYLMGKGFYQLPTDHASEEEHKVAAGEGLELAKKLISEVEVLILDEVINAVGDGLIEESELMKLIEERGEVHMVLTGRGASKGLIEKADLVTEMVKVKHPFDKGKMAVKGLDY